jgi:type IV pilus assembly protein PilA
MPIFKVPMIPNHQNYVPRRICRNGFSLIELLIVVAIILIIAAIAIPNLLRAKIAANEASAVGSLRTINTACANYSTTFGGSYPASLTVLGPSTSPSSTAADLLDDVVSSGIKSGYTFSFSPGPADVNGLVSSYSITAIPMSFGFSGQRGFYTDQSLVIRFNTSGTASSSDSPIG